jgi:hydroxymethylpyrimidine pyrophosphatase-like HAD family hydrolase
LNDLAAMSIVGTPVAMGGAAPAVRKVARHQVGDAEAGGLADAIEHGIEQARRDFS